MKLIVNKKSMLGLVIDGVIFLLCYFLYRSDLANDSVWGIVVLILNFGAFIHISYVSSALTNRFLLNLATGIAGFFIGNQFYYIAEKGRTFFLAASIFVYFFVFLVSSCEKPSNTTIDENIRRTIWGRFNTNLPPLEFGTSMGQFITYGTANLGKVHMTNNQYYNKLSQTFEKIRVVSTYTEHISPPIDWTSLDYNQTSYRAVYNGLTKGIEGEEKVFAQVNENGLKLIWENCFKDSASNEKVEIDGLIVSDHAIYLLEVKNYDVHHVTLTSGGSLYKTLGDHDIPMDTLSQVARHRNVIRRIVGNDIEIINLIVLASGAVITDNLNNPHLKLLSIDALPFFLSTVKQTNNPDRLRTVSILKENAATESQFPFPAITELENKLSHELSLLKSKLADYIHFCDSIESYIAQDMKLNTFSGQIVQSVYDEIRAHSNEYKNIYANALAHISNYN